MRIKEAPKRSQFSIPFHLGKDFTIGIKGCVLPFRVAYHLTQGMGSYGLVTVQAKGAYKYFADQGQTLDEVTTKTVYLDEVGFI